VASASQKVSVGAIERGIYRTVKTFAERRQRLRPKIPLTHKPSSSTVYFLTPDYDVPAGGVRVMYSHVDLLNEAGIDAAILHQRKGFRCTWFQNETRVTDTRSAAVGPDDVLVVCELDVDVVASLREPVRHVILNQSGHLTWGESGDAVSYHYANACNLLGVIVISDYSAQMLEHVYPSLKICRVRNSIDPRIFHLPTMPAGRTLSYTPRRGRRETDLVMHMLRGRGSLDGWDVLPLERLNQAEFAAALRSSRIHVCLSYWEGFGLPTCEAMACGNYVVGFHGFGGREFMLSGFSFPIETGDVLAAAQAIERVIAEDSADDQWCASRGKLASDFVLSRYSQQRQRDTVLSAYRDLLKRS
jgi:hypothetical protein